jgi:lipopolysaccharide export system protein LptA
MILRRASVCLLFVLALPLRTLGAEPPAAVPTTPLVPTVITSGALEMVSTAKETTFTYSKGVKITATTMVLTCDDLVVIARRSGDPAALFGKQEKFKSLVATGGVRLVQDDREATAARAEVFPDEDRVVLTGDPVVVRSMKDGWAQTGPEAELLRGERKAIFKSKGDVRPETTLPDLKDLGYEKQKPKPTPKGPPPANAPAETALPAAAAPAVTVPLPAPRK